jgi:hypothetical protein
MTQVPYLVLVSMQNSYIGSKRTESTAAWVGLTIVESPTFRVENSIC